MWSVLFISNPFIQSSVERKNTRILNLILRGNGRERTSIWTKGTHGSAVHPGVVLQEVMVLGEILHRLDEHMVVSTSNLCGSSRKATNRQNVGLFKERRAQT